jgi:hypothetical protein
MKNARYLTIILSIGFQTMFSVNLSAQHFQINSTLDTSVTPANLHIRIAKPDHALSKVRLISLNDRNNTQILNFYFKGCALNQMTTYLDTVISINAPYPFDLRAYTIWDTSSACPYPSARVVIDSLVMRYGSGTTVNTVQKTDDLIQVFPNPSKDVLHLKADKGLQIISVRFINAAGSLITTSMKANHEISTANLAKGNYILEINTSKGLVRKKITLQ